MALKREVLPGCKSCRAMLISNAAKGIVLKIQFGRRGTLWYSGVKCCAGLKIASLAMPIRSATT